MRTMIFIANNTIGTTGMSGGDRIWIELVRAWHERMRLVVFGCEESLTILEQRVPRVAIETVLTDRIAPSSATTVLNLFRHVIRRTIQGIRAVRRHTDIITAADFVYSTSDFYPDSLPAWYAKIRNPRIQWIAGYYLFAPFPLSQHSPYRGRAWLRGLLYWMMQRLSYFLVRRYADYVCVTSAPDVERFVTRYRGPSRVIVVQGGVDIVESERYLESNAVRPVAARKYDACFVGRFHYQKGVIELVEIWRRVVDQLPRAKLAMIGIGTLEADVRAKISALGLTDHIDLLGYRDGPEKYAIFKESRVIVHPATYDSGGMAAAEAMAWGLPGVAFDLPALETYYPRGMLKARRGDLDDFAGQILQLLRDGDLHDRLARQARELIVGTWDWRRRAEAIRQVIETETGGR